MTRSSTLSEEYKNFDSVFGLGGTTELDNKKISSSNASFIGKRSYLNYLSLCCNLNCSIHVPHVPYF
jgi:hypothetical protein